MKLTIKNINKIRKAEIKLDGLTVIVGENDTGKSTVGRVLFSAIKSLVNTKGIGEKTQKDQLRKFISSYNKRLSSIPYITTTFPVKLGSSRFTSEVDQLFLPRKINEFLEQINASNIDEFIKVKVDQIDKLVEATPRIKSLLKEDLNAISICLRNGANRAANLYNEFNFIAESEFLNQLAINKDGDSIIEIEDDNKIIFQVHFDVKNSAHCDKKENVADITYVESPLYLHILDLINSASLYRETNKKRRSLFGMVPFHIQDFARKMEDVPTSHQLELFSSSYDVSVEKITGGHFYYDDKRKSIIFKKDDIELYPLNVASGIKSFGVMQMLLDGDSISAERPLIWDEPENHLHPEWQIEFADILVQVAKSGVPIVISTHSPYFLQAVRYYAAAHGLEKFVHYYSANDAGYGKVDMEEITDNLSTVFGKLAAPLNKVMNVDAIRKGIQL